jgi:tetratricopeptide (TPR) repeat protein
VDVAPSILNVIQATVPAVMQGQSFLPQVDTKIVSDRPSYAESEYSHRGFGWSSLEALRAGNFLFVKAPQPELYDQAQDPEQNRNVYKTDKLAAVRIAGELDRFAKKAGANAPEAASASLDEQSVEKLRAMGYMASSQTGVASSGVDPKTHIQVANDLHEANLKIEEGRETVAIPLLERVVASDPQIPHAQYFLGVAYKEMRQYDKAILHLDKAIHLVPDSMMGHYEIALAMYSKGDLKPAAAHLEIVVQHSPDWTDARFSLAAIYARTDRLPEALANLDITLQLDPDHYRANLLRGRILSLQGDAAGGLPNLEKAATVEPKSVEAHQFLSEAYEKLGQSEHAAREHAEAERLKSPATP